MHNTYFSSTVYGVRCKESFSSSFNDYSNFWYERLDRSLSNCSSCCHCCDCCALSTFRVPIKPILLNGLRQSALLQLSASRRLILGCGDRYVSRLPAYGLHRDFYELNCSADERPVSNSSRRIKGRCFRLVSLSQKRGETFHSFDSDDSEAVLSFLSEEADNDAIGMKNNVSSSKRLEAEKTRKKLSRRRHLSLIEKVETEIQGKYETQQHETSTTDLRREHKKSSKEREACSKSENHKKRRDVSSCSSYYSLSSGDIGSDLEVQDKSGFEELWLEYEKDESNHMEGQVKEEFNRERLDSKKVQGVSNKERVSFGADIDLRKKFEKKLTEGTMQEAESRREHQDMLSRASRRHEYDYGKTSFSHKQIDSEEDNSSFIDNMDTRTSQAYVQTVNRRMHQYTDTQDSGGDEIETTLVSRKTSRGREGNLVVSENLSTETSDEHKKTVGSTSSMGKETSESNKTFSGREGNLKMSETLIQETRDDHKKVVGSTSTTGKDVISLSSQRYTGNSKYEDSEKTSNPRMKNLGVNKVSVLGSVQGVEEQQHQEEKMIQTKERRRRSQQFSEVSQDHEINVEDTSAVMSRTRIKNQEESLKFSSGVKGTWLQTDRRTAQSFQHRKGSKLVSTLSEGFASDEKQASSSQRTSEVRFIPKSKSTSVVKTRESSCQTDDSIGKFELVFENRRPGNLSISEAGKPVISAEGDERSFATMSSPSTSQMGRNSTHVGLTVGITSPEILLETSESSSSALYDNSGRSPALLSGPYSECGSDQAYGEPSIIMAPEDTLGSAARSEKSSRQFVDEFVGRVEHEVTTSETQEMEVTGTNLDLEVEGNRIYSSRQQEHQNDSQSKDQGSSHSSGFPGTKGPSDEMWDVTEPSVEQDVAADEPEISKEPGKQIVNRTGRSLWSMIADVVRLRWGTHASSSTSAGKSGERNSSNKSDSETWFSGQEHEETSKSDVTKETGVLPHAVPSDKLKPGKSYTQSVGEVSNTKKLKDKGKNVEVGSSSPNTFGSGLASVGASYASGEEITSLTEDGKDLKVATSGMPNMELPISLPAGGPPVVGEIVNISGPDVSGTGSVVPIKAPGAQVQSELSGLERKEGELKQRKFQRTRQVVRDRFDEWEEAYKVELEQRKMDEMFMREALLEAKKAADTWEVPVGAVLVQHGKIIARGCNLVEELRDSTAHAEMICIREASNLLRSWRLSETTLYVTLEPCPMCAGAILQARIDTVVWGAPNKLLGADGSWIRIFPDGGENVSDQRDLQPAPVHPFHPKMKIRRGVLATECADVMQQFFQLRRKKKNEPPSNSRLSITRHNPSKLLNKIHDIFHVMFCL